MKKNISLLSSKIYKIKRAVFMLLLTLPLTARSQCTECTSLTEALKKPEIVISLKINGWQAGARLDSLPQSIGLLVNAKILYISDHRIKTIPKEIGNLKNLKELSFAACLLENLPEEIFTLTNLKELILLDNQFSDETKTNLKIKFKKLLPGTKVFL